MKKQILGLLTVAGLLISPSLNAVEHMSADCWQTWISPATDQVTDNQITEFRSKLSPTEQKSFDTAGKGTQALSVAVQRGLTAANPEMNDSYGFAYKIANKAEVGYYMNQVKERLDY